MSSQSREQRLAAFVEWVVQHITGDEKGQAQIFLDRLFQAFGQKGSLDVGGTPELRIKQSAEDGGGTSFADYVWKPVVLIEMKKRGVDLRRHYRQAFDYWVRLVPDRPRYVVLCNFDEFHVYDFDRQIDQPLDTVAIKDLPTRFGPLAFLFPTNEAPTFGNDREKVTREAADRLATCYTKLEARKVDPGLRQRFVLQMLVALFAEDIGLLERYTVAKLLEECKEPADSYDKLGGLFEAMNRREGNPGGRYKGVRYFNGGIFREPARIELHPDELFQLKEACKDDWSKVSPEIFGTIFEHSMGKASRHAFGAHYTSQIDILKIVKPTIVDPWEAAIREARTGKRLTDLLRRLSTLRVLDPACGSGNFLYVAYREMKRLEQLIRERLATDFPTEQAELVHVNARQFYGMDINEFAVELAKVTMMIGRKLAIEQFHIADEADLPLDNLDENFKAVDALMQPMTIISHLDQAEDNRAKGEGRRAKGEGRQYSRTVWPPADIIIGNPPFLGAKRLKPEHGADYVNAVRKLYPDVPGMADFCVYWIRRSHDHLPECTKADPFAGRAGLVGTQNIRNNQSRVGGLDHVVATGTIIEAVDNQPWSGEAVVHVSIANWVKSKDAGIAPKIKRLWTEVQSPLPKKRRNKLADVGERNSELKDRECVSISASLSDETDVSSAVPLKANREPMRAFRGFEPGNMGFLLDNEQAQKLLEVSDEAATVVHPYLTGDEIVSGDGLPTRWVIDFQRMTMPEAMRFKKPFEHVEKVVLKRMQQIAGHAKSDDEEFAARIKERDLVARLDNWWQLRRCVPETRTALASISRYVACPLVTRRPVFVFVGSEIYPNNKTQPFGFEDDYSFGILQSGSHWEWFLARCAKLKSDFSYSPTNIFDTFPWPQSPTKKQIDAVAAAGREVRRVRDEALKVLPGGLRAVYRSLELPGRHPLKDAHADLDAAVLAAYGFSPKADLLAQLLELNNAVAAREKAGEPVAAPGVPPSYGDPKPLISEDCIRL